MNPRLFPFVIGRYVDLVLTALYSVILRFSFYRLFLILFLLPLFIILQAIHWFFFLTDELFFPGYRNVTVDKPLFITGLPRSATTFIHRVLAEDTGFSTMSCWECLFAPSITERKIILFFIHRYKQCGRPLAGICKNFRPGFITRFDAVHKIRLQDPEEDYLTLMPLLSCFLLVLAFPEAKKIWRLGFFNTKIKKHHKVFILNFYKAMLQKHLFVHGRDTTMLSKNAAFCSLIPDLRHTFPDCCIIVMQRDPIKAYKSQLSSIAPGIRFLGTAQQGWLFSWRFLDLFAHYCTAIEENRDIERLVPVAMKELSENLPAVLQDVYRAFNLQMQAEMVKKVMKLAVKARGYRSSHRYDLDLFFLNDSQIQKRLAPFCRNKTNVTIRTAWHEKSYVTQRRADSVKMVPVESL